MTIKEYALDAWAREQEKSKQSDLKKRKRKAKKIEQDIQALLPKDWAQCEFNRDLADAVYGVVVRLTEADAALRFTHDGKDQLVMIGECAACHKEALSVPIDCAAGLGALFHQFESGRSHECSGKDR